MKNNFYAQALGIIGICIFIFGIIGSFALGYAFKTVYGDYNWGVVIIGVVSSIISGTIFLSLAEVINLLESIIQKIDGIKTHNIKTYETSQPQKVAFSSQTSVDKQKTENISFQKTESETEAEAEDDGNTVVIESRPTVEPIICPKCGKSQRNYRNVCQNCGVKFKFISDWHKDS